VDKSIDVEEGGEESRIEYIYILHQLANQTTLPTLLPAVRSLLLHHRLAVITI
jgi:hypothetical protein